MFSELANRIGGVGVFQEGGAGSAEPQGRSMPGVSQKQQPDQGGWRQRERERARMVRYGVGKVREEIRKGLGMQGRLWILL